jgi:hypothetical protein
MAAPWMVGSWLIASSMRARFFSRSAASSSLALLSAPAPLVCGAPSGTHLAGICGLFWAVSHLVFCPWRVLLALGTQSGTRSRRRALLSAPSCLLPLAGSSRARHAVWHAIAPPRALKRASSWSWDPKRPARVLARAVRRRRGCAPALCLVRHLAAGGGDGRALDGEVVAHRLVDAR